ncbi:MAG: hypothetical protein ACREIF_04875, partial [Chthoniobacterales bacterium]
VRDYSTQGWEEAYRGLPPRYEGFAVITIQNTGTKQATGIELIEPYQGVAVLERPGSAASSLRTTGKIVIGALLPQETATISLWTLYHAPYRLDDRTFMVNFSDGVGVIQYQPTLSDMFETVFYRHPFVVSIVFVAIAVGVIFGITWTIDYFSRRRRRSTT